MNGHILVVEDEVKIAHLLKDYLENADYKVSCLYRGDKVPAFVKQKLPDLILLDIMLPGMDGLEVCREIRRFSDIPIIMLTAKVEEGDRITGLETGADDYVCKPFSPREVVVRVKAVLKRAHPQKEKKRITVGSIDLDENKHTVSIHNSDLSLTPIEFNLLKILLKNPDRVFSRSELLDKVQGYEFEGYERTIDTHIKNIRRKVNSALPGKNIIQSIYAVGYKLNSSET